MRIKRAIIVVTAVIAVFAAVATAGSIAQKAQDAGISTIDPGFVPSTGQINNGTRKLPS
jgi:hypothetical protein